MPELGLEVRPLVRVGAPILEDLEFGEDVKIDEALVLACSDCGDLTDWKDKGSRHLLQLAAYQHARDVHEGDVDREGWA